MSNFEASNTTTSQSQLSESPSPVRALPLPAPRTSPALSFVDNLFMINRLIGNGSIFRPYAAIPAAAAAVGASKACIDGLPKVMVTEEGAECSICLTGLKAGEDIAREMPCKHRFHSACIDNWLGRRASCPLCRSPIVVAAVQKKAGHQTTASSNVIDLSDDDDDDVDDMHGHQTTSWNVIYLSDDDE